MTERGLAVENLSVVRGGRTILEDIAFSCGAGEFVVIAGPSGSGKSTLLQALAGLLPLAAGSITLAGQDLHALPPGRREIAMVFQDHILLPHLSVLENLCFGLRARGVPRGEARRRAGDVAARLELEQLLERRPGAISGGEQQRVALGRAMLRQARLVLMDEPLSSLDAPLRARLRGLIRELHRTQGWTTLYVTHDQAEALALADCLGVMQSGRLLQLGPPREVYQAPGCLAVARFLGEPTINVLPLTYRGPTACVLDQALVDAPCQGAWLAGLRPEAVMLDETGAAPAPARVAAIEYVGSRQQVHLHWAGQAVVADRPADQPLAVDQPVWPTFDPARLRLFAADTGRAR